MKELCVGSIKAVLGTTRAVESFAAVVLDAVVFDAVVVGAVGSVGRRDVSAVHTVHSPPLRTLIQPRVDSGDQTSVCPPCLVFIAS